MSLAHVHRAVLAAVHPILSRFRHGTRLRPEKRCAIHVNEPLEVRALLTTVLDAHLENTADPGHALYQTFRYTFDQPTLAEDVRNAFVLFNLSLGQAADINYMYDFRHDNTPPSEIIGWPLRPNRQLSPGYYEAELSAGGVNNLELDDDVITNFGFYPADFDGDLACGFTDLLTLSQHYNTPSGMTFAQGDANFDGAVNFSDLLILSQRFGGSLQPLPAGANDLTVGSPTPNSLTLSWSAPDDDRFDGFYVWRSTDGSTFTKLDGVDIVKDPNSAGNYSYTDTTVDEGQKYYYRVRPHNETHLDAALGVWHTTNKAQDITILRAPTNLQVAVPDTTKPWRVKLDWTANSTTATRYEVRADVDGDGAFERNGVQFVTASGPGSMTTTFDFPMINVSPTGTSNVRFEIVAMRGSADVLSAPAIASATVSIPTDLRQPTEVWALKGPTATRPADYVVSWMDNAGNESGYVILASANGGSTFSQATATPALNYSAGTPTAFASHRAVVVTAPTGVTYTHFVVRAIRDPSGVNASVDSAAAGVVTTATAALIPVSYAGELAILVGQVNGGGEHIALLHQYSNPWLETRFVDYASQSINDTHTAELFALDYSTPGAPRFKAFNTGDITDKDHDKLVGYEESYVYGTDPNYYDTDGDGLPDGWEVAHGDFANPGESDLNDNGTADGADDQEDDGLTNQEEVDAGTDPTNEDTDGDGVTDSDELTQGSDPLDDLDGGEAPADDMKAKFTLTTGDPSGSHSEQWAISAGDRRYTAPGYGLVGSKDKWFDVGKSYDISLDHLGTSPTYLSSRGAANYDWTASVARTTVPSAPYWIDNPVYTVSYPGYAGIQYSLLSTWIWDVVGEPNLAEGKVAHLHIPQLDLDVDSDNNNGLSGPDRSSSEDRLEQSSSGAKEVWVGAPQFVPVTLSLSSNVTQAQPSSLQLTLSGWDASTLRLWKPGFSTPGSNPSGNILTPGTAISASSIGLSPGGSVTLYVEALKTIGAAAAIASSMQVTGAKWSGVIADVVRIITGDVKANDGQEGSAVPSVRTTGVIFKHFVTPKKASADIVVSAITHVAGNFDDHYEWGGDGSPVDGSPEKRKVSRTASGKFVLLLKDKATQQTLNTYVVWVVWSSGERTVTPNPIMPMTTISGDRNGTLISFNMNAVFSISPIEIIDITKDVPDLRGANVGPDLPGADPVGGALYKNGVNARWDVSRRRTIRAGVSNYQPALPVDPFEDYPLDDYFGNDDASTFGEDNDPYGGGEVGKLTSNDTPQRNGPIDQFQLGTLGAFYTSRIWFQEFARLQLGDAGAAKWFVISDPLDWRVVFNMRKVKFTEAFLGRDLNRDGVNDTLQETDLNQDTNGDGAITAVDAYVWDVDPAQGSFCHPDNSGIPARGEPYIP